MSRWSLGLALGLGIVSPATVARAAPVEIVPSHIQEALVPSTLVRGDREFDGHGPDIVARVTVRPSADRTKLEAVIYFKATETVSDWSTTEQTWTKTIFNAPSGKRIARIVGPTVSEVRFRSQAAGFQFLAPSKDVEDFFKSLVGIATQVLDAERTLSNRSSDTDEVAQARQLLERVRSGAAWLPHNENHVHTVNPQSGPVELFAIVGDTGGPDISDDDDPKDDTRIEKILFGPVQIEYEGEATVEKKSAADGRCAARIAAAQQGSSTVALMGWYSSGRRDNLSASSTTWIGCAGDTKHPDYGFSRVHGRLFSPAKPQPAGTVALYQWYSPSRSDHLLTADPGWAGRPGATRAPDYRFVDVVGYVYPANTRADKANLVPLYRWYSPSRGDNYTTTDPRWAGRPGDSRSPDYRFAELVGYILPPS